MASDLPSEREAAKRRLMFVPGEDFYFLAYTTFVLLAELKSTAQERALHDSRKVAYLADLLGSDSDLRLALTLAPLNQSGRSRLALLYDRAAARHAPLERIEDALSRRGIVNFSREPGSPDRLFLKDSDAVTRLLSEALYDGERERIRKLRSSLPQLRTMTLATMKERLFARHGVHTWGD